MLAHLQKIVVRMMVDARLAEAVYRKDANVLRDLGVSAPELDLVQQIPPAVIENYQKSIAVDRALSRGSHFLMRTFTMLGSVRTAELIHQYCTDNVMLQNDWGRHISAFQQFLHAALDETSEEDGRVWEVLRFEMLLHRIAEQTQAPLHHFEGMQLCPHVRACEFCIEPEVLVDENSPRDLILESFGEPRKLLLVVDGNTIDLYDLEPLQYEIAVSCQEPISYQDLKRQVLEMPVVVSQGEACSTLDDFLDELFEMELMLGERV